jgi:hypothetical protein
MFKMTFNKPAVKMFFLGEDAVGIRIKVEGNAVFFKPVHKIGGDDSDVVEITDKRRGGAEATIEGSQAGHLLSLLTNPLGNPYYILQRRTGGWMEAVPHAGKGYAPERWEAHIRIWPRETIPAQSTVVEELNLHENNANPIQEPLPASEQIRSTLQMLESTVSGISCETPQRAFAAAREASSIIDRLFQHFAENPLPLQKTRKPRAMVATKPVMQNVVVTPTKTDSSIFRRQRERAFGQNAH